jgi:hypothetical protein
MIGIDPMIGGSHYSADDRLARVQRPFGASSTTVWHEVI